MDFTVGRDGFGRCFAELSMGQEAFGRWLADELGEDAGQLQRILDAIGQLRDRRIGEFALDGRTFRLELDRDEARVRAHCLENETLDVDGEDLDFYDDELEAGCGLDDFVDVLFAWQELITG
ncbi:MAG: YacL family protein [Oceanospirillaceae bacterium]|nr:YacL family protein [Oceanospirillaceae bacterium]